MPPMLCGGVLNPDSKGVLARTQRPALILTTIPTTSGQFIFDALLWTLISIVELLWAKLK